MKTGVSRLDRLLALIFPQRCLLCGRITIGGQRVCERCLKENPPRTLFSRVDDGESDFSKPVFCVSACRYGGTVRRQLLRYKFKGRQEKAVGFSQAILITLPPGWQTVDLVTWCPISKERYQERGYDQSELLAHRIGRKLGAPCHKLLEKIKDNCPQMKLNARERRLNVIGAYRVSFPEEKIMGKRILLIDDIVTTGATLWEWVKCLQRAGAAEVLCATVAATRKE